MDTLSRCCRHSPGLVAGDGGPLHHCDEFSSAGLFLFTRRSDVCRHRCLSSAMGWDTGIHLSAICPDPSGSEQSPRLQGDSSHPHNPLLATEKSGSLSSRVWLWLFQRPFHFGEISNSRISNIWTRTSPCFAFMCGDFTALRLHLRSLQTGHHSLSLCRR